MPTFRSLSSLGECLFIIRPLSEGPGGCRTISQTHLLALLNVCWVGFSCIGATGTATSGIMPLTFYP